MPEQPCAFHPDRITGVTCSRCERPICPDDMIDAPVGIHCPVCAGRMSEGPLGQARYRAQQQLETIPFVRRFQAGSLAVGLIAINVVVAVLMYSTGEPTASKTLFDFGAVFSPLPRSNWWRLFTSMFVHIGLLHLAFNMFGLWIFGRALEARYGKLRFLLLYVCSGLLGGGASLAFTTGGLRAGASGGLFGIVGGFAAFYLVRRNARGATDQLRGLMFLIGVNLFWGFSVGYVDNAAHVGGLIGGLLIGLGIEFGTRARAFPLAQPASVMLVLALAGILIWPNTF